MRFQVGKIYPFVLIEFVTNAPRLGNLYLPWEDKLLTLQIKMLECQEHVLVPFQGYTEPEHDGFIFKGMTAGQWFNQYPTYYDNQMSDTNCWIVREDFHPSGERPRKMTLATRYLEQIDRGITDLRKQGREDWALQLEAHFKVIELDLLMTHRLKTVIRPIVLEDHTGKKTSFPDITEVVLEQATA